MVIFSLKTKNQEIQRQLTVAEFNLTQTKSLLSKFEKKFAKNQEQQINPLSENKEYEEFKQENISLKEENKKLNEELRIKLQELKKLETLHIDKIYALTNERDALAAQIKETKSNISKVISLQAKLRFAEHEIEKLNIELRNKCTNV